MTSKPDLHGRSSIFRRMLQGWRSAESYDVASRHADLARLMRAINVLGMPDLQKYAFLGIAELPISLERRGQDLCRIINVLKVSQNNRSVTYWIYSTLRSLMP